PAGPARVEGALGLFRRHVSAPSRRLDVHGGAARGDPLRRSRPERAAAVRPPRAGCVRALGSSRRMDLRDGGARREPYPELPQVRAARVDARPGSLVTKLITAL